MSSGIKLKPCPFCGSGKLFIYPPEDDPLNEMKLFQREKGRGYWGYVSCECGAKCSANFYSAWPDKVREAAAKIWNRRAEAAKADAQDTEEI